MIERGQVSVRAAALYGGCALLVIAFQIALAAGAPWGGLAMGGAFPGRLPPAMRAASLVQAALQIVMAMIVGARARRILPAWYAASRRLIWAVVAVLAIAAVLNAITPSWRERAIWLPVTITMLACAVIVARARVRIDDASATPDLKHGSRHGA